MICNSYWDLEKKPVTCNNLLSILYIIHFKLQNWTALDVRDGFAEILSCVFVFVLWIFLLTKHHKFQCILLLLPLMLLDNKDYLQRAPHWPSSGSSPPFQGCSIRPLSRPIIQLLLSRVLFKEPHFHFQSLLSHNFKNPYQGLKCDLQQKCKHFESCHATAGAGGQGKVTNTPIMEMRGNCGKHKTRCKYTCKYRFKPK